MLPLPLKMCSEGSRKASGGRVWELAALGGSGYDVSGTAVFLKGMLGRLRGVPLSVLERFLTASDIAEGGGAESSSCSALELDLESAAGEFGMERDERLDSSLNEGGAKFSLDGRLRASLDCGGGASVLGAG